MTGPRPGGRDRNAAMRETVQQLLTEYQQQLDRLGQARQRLADRCSSPSAGA